MIDEPDVEQAIDDLNNLLNGTATFKKGRRLTSNFPIPYLNKNFPNKLGSFLLTEHKLKAVSYVKRAN